MRIDSKPLITLAALLAALGALWLAGRAGRPAPLSGPPAPREGGAFGSPAPSGADVPSAGEPGERAPLAEPAEAARALVGGSAGGPAAPEGIALALETRPAGLRLSSPKLAVTDPVHPGTAELADGSEIELESRRARTLGLKSLVDGWVPEPASLELGPEDAGRFAVGARPLAHIVLTAEDARTGRAIERASLLFVWEVVLDGCCPFRRELGPLDVELAEGSLVLEGPPFVEGRFRLELATPEHYRARSDWTELDPSGWTSVGLELSPREGASARVAVSVREAGSGRPLAGALVSLSEEYAGAPIDGLRVTREGLVVARGGQLDPDLVEPPTEARTDAAGACELVVRAPARYRAAVWLEGHTEVLTEPFDVAPSQAHPIQVELAPGAALRGRVHRLEGDAALSAIKRLGGLQLARDTTTYTAALDARDAFAFDGLPPGSYTLTLRGVIDLAGREALIPVARRELELAAGQVLDVELALGSLESGRELRGQIAALGGDSPWRWYVAILAAREAQALVTPGARPPEPFKLAPADAAGGFALRGVPEGALVVVAMGQREDQRGIAFARADLAVAADSPALLEVALACAGRPLVVQASSGAPADAPLGVRVESACEDALTRYLIGELPPLQVGEGPSVYYGLPEEPAELVVGEERVRVDWGGAVQYVP